MKNLEQDLLYNSMIIHKCKSNYKYSQNLYAALCNNKFFYNDEEWTCSWRYAGGLVSEINGGSDYMDFYCSGINAVNSCDFMVEGQVTDEIRNDLLQMGWIIKPYDT